MRNDEMRESSAFMKTFDLFFVSSVGKKFTSFQNIYFRDDLHARKSIHTGCHWNSISHCIL